MNAITPAEQKLCQAYETIHCNVEEALRLAKDDAALIQVATIKGNLRDLFQSIVDLRGEMKGSCDTP